MTFGPRNSSGGGGGGKRRRRGRRGPGTGRPGQNKGQQRNQTHQQRNNPGGIFTSPMDHNYRNGQGGQSNSRRGGLPSAYQPMEPEPLPAHHQHGEPRIFCFIEDLFFLAKIQETGRKLNVKVEFVKTDKDILERASNGNGNEKPSLIIFDLNNLAAKPLQTIPKLKKELKKETTIIGFVSHVQGDLKLKAMEAGCDMVIPRSAFSQNLPNLLRRHGALDEFDDVQ
jgi:hypothetical protein